jgi:hypothetical protein
MASFSRSLKRKKKVEKKKAFHKALKQAIKATANMPKKCFSCEKEFTDHENKDEWRVSMYPSGIRLQCPECFVDNS